MEGETRVCPGSLRHDLESGGEWQGEDRASVLVFDFDPVAERDLPASCNLLGGELARCPDRSFPGDRETGELLAFVINGYGIAVDMEKVSGHG